MDIVNTVKLHICGSEYSISTSENPAYVVEIGEYIDNAVSRLMQQSPNLSITKALLLCCLNTLDELNQANTNADNLRKQIKEYLEDAARSRSEVDELRRDLSRLKKELAQAERLSGGQKHYDKP